MAERAVSITVFRWAGRWGPFRVKIPCGECALSDAVVRDTLTNELAGIPVELTIHDWLTEWWRPLLRGGWHAPIIMVEKKVISQGKALNRGLLTQEVVSVYARHNPVRGTHIFGKAGCPHCSRARKILQKTKTQFTYHDVVRSSRALYEMIARVKPLISAKTPITLPQIWVDGQFIGTAEALSQHLKKT